MEASKKIILLNRFTRISILVILLSLNSCTTNNSDQEELMNDCYKLNIFYKDKNAAGDPIIFNPTNRLLPFKENLYLINQHLFMGIDYKEAVYGGEKDIIIKPCKGTFLCDSLNGKSIKSLIDINSYVKIIDNHIYKDRNFVYFLPKNYELPSLFILDLDPSKAKVLDKRHTYIRDDKTVYCIPSNTIVDTKYPESFDVIELSQITFGVDGNYLYEYENKIDKEAFLNYYEFLNKNLKDSLIKIYFTGAYLD